MMHTNNLRKLASETNDGVLRGPAFDAADEIDRLRSEINRMGRELNLAKYGEPNFSWSIHKKAMADLLARAEKAEAEVARLTKERDTDHANINLKADFIEATINQLALAEAERDEARAQVAAALATDCRLTAKRPAFASTRAAIWSRPCPCTRCKPDIT